MFFSKNILKSLLLFMITILLLVACNENDNNGSANHKFNLGHTTSTKSHQHRAGEVMNDVLQESSEGDLGVEVYEMSQLGGDIEMLEALQEGSEDLTTMAHATVTNFVPEWSVLDMPYLFDSSEQADEILKGEVGDKLFEYLPDHDLKGLSWIATPERNVFGNKKIENIDDFENLKIRVIEASGFVDTYASFEADPVTMSGDEVYTALQQGVVDASDNSADLFVNLGHHEVSEYYNTTRVHTMPTALIMSLEVWEDLDEENQERVMEAAEAAAEASKKTYKSGVDDALDEMENELGIEIVETDTSEMEKKSKELESELIKDVPEGEELLKLIEEEKEKLK